MVRALSVKRRKGTIVRRGNHHGNGAISEEKRKKGAISEEK